MTRKTLTFLLAYLCVVTLVKADVNQEQKKPKIDPEWRKPDAWSLHREQEAKEEKLKGEENDEKSFVVPQESSKKDDNTIDIGKTYYMRFAKILFDEKKFKKGESGYITRIIHLEKNQLDLINELIDDDKLGELDAVILKELKKSPFTWVQMAKEEALTFFEYFDWIWSNEDAKLVIQIFAFFIVVILVKKYCGWSKTVSTIVIFLLISIFFQWKECKNRMNSKMVCDAVDSSHGSWYAYFSSKKKTCMDQMHKTDTDMCRLDKFLIIYFGELFHLINEKFVVNILWSFHVRFGMNVTITITSTIITVFFGYMKRSIFKDGPRKLLRALKGSSDVISSATPRNNTQKPLNKPLQTQMGNRSHCNRSTNVDRVEEVREDEIDDVPNDGAEEFVIFNSENIAEEQTNLPPGDEIRPHIEIIESIVETALKL